MVVVDSQHCVVGGRGKLLPVVNVKLLERLFVKRGFLHGVTVRQVHSCAVDGDIFTNLLLAG